MGKTSLGITDHCDQSHIAVWNYAPHRPVRERGNRTFGHGL
jgi:hypothetical protein